MAVTQDDLFRELDRIKKKGTMSPAAYQEFMPSAVPNTPDRMDTDLLARTMRSVVDRSDAVTKQAFIEEKNKRDYDAMLEAQKRMAEAEKMLKKAKRPVVEVPVGQPNYVTQQIPVATQPAKLPKMPKQQATGKVPSGSKQTKGKTKTTSSGPVVRNTSSGAWKDTTPFRGTSVGANLVTIHTPGGKPVTVNRDMANNFSAFLKALVATGYRIDSIGGYANRGNTSNPSVKSMHAYGLAIDINPSQNPYGHSLVTNMPPGVGRLAAKYGLQWGGNWNSVKDAMHFSMVGGYGGSGG